MRFYQPQSSDLIWNLDKQYYGFKLGNLDT